MHFEQLADNVIWTNEGFGNAVAIDMKLLKKI